MAQHTRSSVLVLALAGLLSALLAVFVPIKTVFPQFSVGFYFGAVLAVYFVAYEGNRHPGRVVAFISACIAAYAMAEFCAVRLYFIFATHEPMGSAKLDIPVPSFFLTGCLGAFVVFTAGVFTFGRRVISVKSLPMIFLWSVGGGFLGVAGGIADDIRTHGTNDHMALLFLIWQPGAAALLGLLLAREKQPLAASPKFASTAIKSPTVRKTREIPLVAAAFFVGIFGFLGYLVLRSIKSERVASEISEARREVIAQAPPLAALPPLEYLPLQQALIVERIAGLYPSTPTSVSSGHGPNSPPAAHYSLQYTAINDEPSQSLRGAASVNVTQLPNADWARYRVNYPDPNGPIVSSQPFTKVQRFGQTVVAQDKSFAGTCINWPSGRFAVSVCYQTPQVPEEILQKYLEKYPSSL